jgi:hypothetical protein
MTDEETGELLWVNTGDAEVRKAFSLQARQRNAAVSEAFKRAGVDFASIGTHENYVKPLMTLFKQRGSER